MSKLLTSKNQFALKFSGFRKVYDSIIGLRHRLFIKNPKKIGTALIIIILILTFQNCGGAKLSSKNESSFKVLSCSAGGKVYEIDQTITGFETSSKIFPNLCSQVTRTCLPSGQFDGQVPSLTCAQYCVHPDTGVAMPFDSKYTYSTLNQGTATSCADATFTSTCNSSTGKFFPAVPASRFSACLVQGQTCAYSIVSGVATPTGNTVSSTVTGFGHQTETYPNLCSSITSICQSSGSWLPISPLFTSCSQNCLDPDSRNPISTTQSAASPYLYYTRSSGTAAECAAALKSATCQASTGLFSPTIDSARYSTCTILAANNYSCEVISNSNNDIWVSLKYQNLKQFDFRIGSGGAIKEFRDANSTALLSPSYSGESTDRVVQLVLWDFVIQRDAYYGDKRLNFNQAGTSNDMLSPTYFVNLQNNTNHCVVDVYSSMEDSWDQGLSPYMDSKSKLLTRYEVIDGKIKVRKILYLQSLSTSGTTISDGTQAKYPQIYLENWIPLNRPAFNALALAADQNANPTWWYNTGNYPNYPAIPFKNTYGFAILYNTTQTLTANMISIIYGKQPAECFGATCGAAAGIGVSSELNSMIWDTGLGILPAAIFSNTPIGAVIDQSFYIFPNKGLNTTSMQQISNTVDGVPSVKLYLSSGDISSPELQVIVQKLKGLDSQTKSRTDRLGTLVK